MVVNNNFTNKTENVVYVRNHIKYFKYNKIINIFLQIIETNFGLHFAHGKPVDDPSMDVTVVLLQLILYHLEDHLVVHVRPLLQIVSRLDAPFSPFLDVMTYQLARVDC